MHKIFADAGDGDFASASTTLAQHLQDQIVSGELKLGESLPSERELMAAFDVSRATVREALRMLGALGLTEVKRGRNGGSFVCGPNGRAVSRSLDLFIQGQSIRFKDLLTAREAIEPFAARDAALNRTASDLVALEELLEANEDGLEDIEKFTKLNLDWHMAVVTASHNPLFIAFMSSISVALYAATFREEFDLQTRKVVIGVHRRILRAIGAMDPDAARRRMGRHVSAYGERLAAIDLASTN